MFFVEVLLHVVCGEDQEEKVLVSDVGGPQGKVPLIVCTALLALLAPCLTISSFMQNVSQKFSIERLKMMW